MQQNYDLPEPIKQVQRSLEPFVKQRNEVAQIRRVLALHLSSHVNTSEVSMILHPPSLLEGTSSVGAVSNGIRGIRKEYLRCVRANIKARQDYESLSTAHQLHNISPESQRQAGGNRDYSKGHDGSGTSLELLLGVIKQRRKHDRLRVLQDYIDVLAQKPGATADHLDLKVVLEDIKSLPSVPTELIVTTETRHQSERMDLKELVDQLEKAVLRAKWLLKKEQKILSKVNADRQSRKVSSPSSEGRLQALGTARNELINWIETELAKAAESSMDLDSGQDSNTTERKGRTHIANQLASIQRQYSQYIQGRQALIVSATTSLETPAPTVIDNNEEGLTGNEACDISGVMSHVMYSCLKELTSVSNEQKSLIQQKSHLTISLAKQLKEAGQGLDRLAEESHLLPSYPVPAVSSLRKGLESSTSFGGEIADHEKPDSSRRAQAWVFASESAGQATKDAVSENLEESEKPILEARHTLLELQYLFGEDFVNSIVAENRCLARSDNWAVLDGHLGVLKRHDVNAT